MQTRRGRLTAVRGILPMAVLCASTIGCSGSAAGTADRFYATTGPDNKLVSIEISDGSKIKITPIGTTGARGCGSVALSADGTLYSVCGPGMMGPGRQQLAKIDPKTGHATLFGSEVFNLQVMGLEFAPDGTLYGVGDANRASPTFNSLYTVDLKTGEFTRIGATGVPDPEFFMDFAFDSRGVMYGASSHELFTIDRKTGIATKVVDFVGGGDIMGLAYNAKRDKLYATDFKTPNSALYVVNTQTGFLTPMASIGYPLSHGLVPVAP
jgi:DNA-binding beta-propeller fold protein YncE